MPSKHLHQAFAEQNGLSFIETSAKDATNINKVFATMAENIIANLYVYHPPILLFIFVQQDAYVRININHHPTPINILLRQSTPVHDNNGFRLSDSSQEQESGSLCC